MNYYTAPMEGLTDRIWRQAHQRWFGAPGAPARYYAPFISPPENRVLIKKKMAELDPAANPGAPVIPQLLAKDGALAAWMIGELRKMGYTEVNLNFGCPSGTVTAKGKGAGMLRDLSKLEVFLDEVFSQVEGPISVKTRLGVTSPEEFEAILDLYDRYPICELTVHPPGHAPALPGRGRPRRFCKISAPLPDARLLQRRHHYPGPAESTGSGVPEPLRHHGGAGHHLRPGPAAAGCGRCARLEGRTAGLPRRTVPRLHRGFRHGQLCCQPDEGPLALPHPAVRGLRSFREAAAQGPGGLGI